MDPIPGTYRKGKVTLEQAVTWLEGQRVEVTPRSLDVQRGNGMSKLGDDANPTLSELEALEPLEFSPEEWSRMEQARAEVNEISRDAVRRRMELPE